MNKAQPYRLSSRQFMQRWTMHILPKGFTRSRSYGGYHSSKRVGYLEQCRRLLGTTVDAEPEEQIAPEKESPPGRTCPHCESVLDSIRYQCRPSWRQIFNQDIYEADCYSPQFHLGAGRAPPWKALHA